MENEIVTLPSPPESRPKVTGALIACGLWLRLAFVGASGVVAGLLQLLEGKAKPLSALALAVAGGLLAAYGAWRAHAVLNAVDGATAPSARMSSAARTGAAAGA